MMELPPLEYTFDTVVLGWREEAVSFAREHGYHLIVNSDQRPFHHFVGYQDIKSKWYEGIFDLGMRSLLPVPFDVQTIGMEDEKLKVVTAGNTKVMINFNTLHIFDLDNCGYLGVEEVVSDYLVHDMFDITSGSRLGVSFSIQTGNNFVKMIRFVPSNRIDRNTAGDFKDLVVMSLIKSDDLKSFDYSETVVRILVGRTLKRLQIKQPNGRSLIVQHSCRHAVKNTFKFESTVDMDERIVLHE
jgi:hypothetical protein